MKRQFTDEDIKKIIELYKSGKTSWQVAEECKCAQSFVINTLKRNNIERRKTHSYPSVIKYHHNEDFFNTINTEEKAYFLGFMYADGNVYIGNNYKSYEVSMALQEQDKAILEQFRSILSPEILLEFIDKETPNHQNQYRLKINSKIICNQLIKLGCTQRKSLTLRYPTVIPISLVNHFIRGYFDGDGSIYNNANHIDTTKYTIDWKWQITSSSYFCKGVKSTIENLLDLHITSRLSNDNNITTTLTVGGNKQVKLIFDWLYKDANIYLQRKYNKYREFKTYLQTH